MTVNTRAFIKVDSKRTRVAVWFFKRKDPIAALFTLLFLVAFCSFALIKPIYEWDLFAYLGNALSITHGFSADELHAKVYQLVEAAVPARNFEYLIGSPSRLVLSQDAEAYRQTMTFFYDARIAYKYILAGLISTGLNPVFALFLFSTLCVVASMFLLMKFIPVKTPTGMFFILPFIILSLGMFSIARLATPDAFAALVTISLYFMLFRNKVTWLLFLLPLVIFVRSDLIVLVAIFQAYILFCDRAPRVLTILSGVATIAAYLAINNYIVDGDPWSSLIGYNYGEKPTHPEGYVFPISVSDYLGYLWIGLLSFTYNPIVFVFFMFTSIGIALLSTRFFGATREFEVTQLHADLLFLFFSSAIYFALHFLLFPVGWIRFFTAQYTMAAVIVCWCAIALLSSSTSRNKTGLEFLKPV